MKLRRIISCLIFCFMFLTIKVKADDEYKYEIDNILDSLSEKLHIDSNLLIPIIAIIGGLLVIIIFSVIRKILYEPFKESNILENSISNRKIKAVDPRLNPEEFKKIVIDMFKTTASAFCDFKYDILKENFSDSLYKDKVFELDSYKKRNLRNIICDITPLYCQINKVQIINGIETVEAVFTARFKDYIVADSDSDVIMSGSKRDTQERSYLLSFSKKESNSVCPKCGGEVENDRCLYCRFGHSIKEEKWFMDKMKILKQRTIGK